MDIHRLKDLPKEERHTVLQGEAVSIAEEAYMRPLTEDEIAMKKDELVSSSILKGRIEDELKEMKAQYKAKIDPIKERVKESLEAIKNRSVMETGFVYKLPDYENQMIYSVTEEGVVLSSRRMLPEERQFRIQNQKSA